MGCREPRRGVVGSGHGGGAAAGTPHASHMPPLPPWSPIPTVALPWHPRSAGGQRCARGRLRARHLRLCPPPGQRPDARVGGGAWPRSAVLPLRVGVGCGACSVLSVGHAVCCVLCTSRLLGTARWAAVRDGRPAAAPRPGPAVAPGAPPRPSMDPLRAQVKTARHPRVNFFLATSEIHMQHKLRMTETQVPAGACVGGCADPLRGAGQALGCGSGHACACGHPLRGDQRASPPRPPPTARAPAGGRCCGGRHHQPALHGLHRHRVHARGRGWAALWVWLRLWFRVCPPFWLLGCRQHALPPAPLTSPPPAPSPSLSPQAAPSRPFCTRCWARRSRRGPPPSTSQTQWAGACRTSSGAWGYTFVCVCVLWQCCVGGGLCARLQPGSRTCAAQLACRPHLPGPPPSHPPPSPAPTGSDPRHQGQHARHRQRDHVCPLPQRPGAGRV